MDKSTSATHSEEGAVDEALLVASGGRAEVPLRGRRDHPGVGGQHPAVAHHQLPVQGHDVLAGVVQVVLLVLLQREDHEAKHEEVDRGGEGCQPEQEEDERADHIARSKLQKICSASKYTSGH